MKEINKIKAGVFVIAALLLATTVTINAEDYYYYDPSEIELNYSFQEPDITQVLINGTWYDHVTIDGLPTFGENATPLLPVKPVNVLLSQRGELESITVTWNSNISLGTGFNVELGREPVIPGVTPENGGTEDINFNPTVPYPVELFHVVETYDFRGYSIMTFNLFPVHYIGETGELYYYPEMNVEITTTDTGIVNPYFRGLPNDEEMMKQKVDDYSMISSYVFPADQLLPSPLVDPSDNYMYVIITNNELKGTFQALKDHKNLGGISTEIVTVEEIVSCSDYWWGGEYGDGLPHFNDLQCQIRNFIKDAYINWETEYVLLGGDDDIIPHRGFHCLLPIVTTEPIDFSDVPADMYYACLDGSFDRNLNDKWADLFDKPDLRAEVYVGRAPVSTSDEADNFISKTLAYEVTMYPYLENVWMVGEYLGFRGIADFGGNYKDEIIDGSDANGYTTVGIPSDEYNISTLYDRDWPGFDPGNPDETGWQKSEIIGRINNGAHIINHLGHAYYNYNMKMGNSDVDALTNDKYCFIYSQGCMAGGFDNPYGYDCIAEYFTVKNDHGAFAGIWNSRFGIGMYDSTDGPSQMFDREFFDAIFGENIREIGRANQDSKEDNIYRLNFTQGDDPEDTFNNLTICQAVRWCYYELNLFGDPTVALKPAVPPEHDVKVVNFVAPDFVIPGENFDVFATVKNMGISYEYDVPVTIFVDGEEDHSYNIPIMAPPPYGSPVTIFHGLDSLDFGRHNITVIAGPVSGEDNTWDNQRTEWVIADHPPEQPVQPWGPTSPKVGDICTYRSYTTDLDTEDGDYLRFRWRWTIEDIPIPGPWSWLTYDSEETVSRIHIWLYAGDKEVEVQAVDSFGLTSDWSDPLEVIAPKSKSTPQPCFLAGTEIAMADESYKNIESITVGDIVKSYNVTTREIVNTTVTKVHKHTPDKMTDHYLVINNNIKVTPNHIVFINDTLMRVKHAKVGDVIVGVNGEDTTIDSIEKVFKKVPTYNFEYMPTSNLYITNDMGAYPMKIKIKNPMKPIGKFRIDKGVKYSYSTFTVDIANDKLFYVFDWGDGTNSGWLGPINSGETVEASHMWTEEGKYNIKVNAKDSHGELSGWSDPLAVAMVK